MGTLFGTDGVRGSANEPPMTADTILRLGQAVGAEIRRRHPSRDRIVAVIGKDTRKSGYVFESALTSGLCSVGVDVYLVGPMPTPSISHLTKSFAADLGIVISASHNPAADNGIKFFDRDGFKLDDAIESEIERAMAQPIDTSGVNGLEVGSARRIEDAAGRYIEYTKGAVGNMSLAGLRLVLDCANGAAYKVAPPIFRELGADVVVLNNTPDGSNINAGCGSLHPEVVSEAVRAHGADLGVALDGDADRVIMVDENGEVIDGDHIIAMCALDMQRAGRLAGNAVVVTVMSNLGFDAAMRDHAIRVIRTDVGDRQVVEAMRAHGCTLGGEQSGHIVFLNQSRTGDGTLSALHVLALMKTSGEPMSALAGCMVSFPQAQRNVRVRARVPLDDLPAVQSLVARSQAGFGGHGRVLVRYSGTEKVCRVMVEGPDRRDVERLADEIASAIGAAIGAG
jgi:phosphoglucosamine mutase